MRQFALPSAARRDVRPVTPRNTSYLPVKRACDVVGAAVLLVLTAPLSLLGLLLVKLTSRGPALYRQVRVGEGGRPFTLLKLRTMKNNAEADTGPVWSTDNDCRVTPVGKVLRRTHIDEFPQLWNVIRGEMSLVGPRPERPEFVAKLDWEVPFYRERLQVRPGITGLAQLRLPPDATLECVNRKVVHDVYYVRHVNAALDAKLMILTAWRLCAELCGFCWKALSLPSNEEVEGGFRRIVGIPHEPAAASHISLTSIAGGSKPSSSDVREFQAIGG